MVNCTLRAQGTNSHNEVEEALKSLGRDAREEGALERRGNVSVWRVLRCASGRGESGQSATIVEAEKGDLVAPSGAVELSDLCVYIHLGLDI